MPEGGQNMTKVCSIHY